ncbi:fumarate reductase flavoprotein subunit [Sphingomonas vulcanisoli]|uniref:Fumarate reductase flavoprotein subunit n=1 Tax=Sphingomonas vulcanisoli TaxID=1658060 RepID=A0ABX0TWK2_9SPHN|nr:FAD-dependent oxidoreductase [Sphingomonas vulcanisoli]NIJ08760.1 fumarate reductase flavoprotein subunit [Sphingomonas vulcanisoli]
MRDISDKDYDVIVVGGGGAGLAVANEASSRGRSVLLLEAADRIGGSTALSHGVFYAAGSHVQAAAGIDDNGDAMFRYAMALNQCRMESAVVHRYCKSCGSALDWLSQLGVEFPRLACVDVSGVARSHFAEGRGVAIVDALHAALSGREVDIAVRSRVDGLCVEDGQVTGVRVGGETVSAHSVVITTGGFGGNPDLVDTLIPSTRRKRDRLWYIGAKQCVGDGLLMAQQAGAAIAGFDRALFQPTPGFQQILEQPPAWLILVNKDGRRFCDESVAYCVLDSLIGSQPDQEAYGIFDADTFANPPRDLRYAAAIAAGHSSTAWTNDVLRSEVNGERLKSASTIEELAENLGINKEALRFTIEQQNIWCEKKQDRSFGKPGEYLRAITQLPFFGAIFRNETLCITLTGLKIDESCRVLQNDGRAIPGLFAAGEVTGSVMGERYIGSGNSISQGITMGRIAGQIV